METGGIWNNTLMPCNEMFMAQISQPTVLGRQGQQELGWLKGIHLKYAHVGHTSDRVHKVCICQLEHPCMIISDFLGYIWMHLWLTVTIKKNVQRMTYGQSIPEIMWYCTYTSQACNDWFGHVYTFMYASIHYN